jgi:excinuclease ABC subunit A
VLHELVDQGNSIVVIEHNLEVIKTADWIIDLGPEGGDGGGELVAQGRPEDVANVAASYTGQYLGPLLRKSNLTPRVPIKVLEPMAPPISQAQLKAERKAAKAGAKSAPAKTTQKIPTKKPPAKKTTKRG